MYKRLIILLFVVLYLFAGTVFAQSREEDSLALVELYDSTDGDNWTDNTNWKSGHINTWYGVTVSGNRVTELHLSGNNLSGTIPSSIGDLTSLTWLYITSNDLTGEIPLSIGNLTNLQYLLLDNNEFTGPIPSEIGNLTSLEELRLYNNDLTGPIPSSIGDMTSLREVGLWGNQLTGPIPSEIGNLESLHILSLNYNQLSDSIPSSIGNLTNLWLLNLNSNNLTGSVPSEIANLTELGLLYIYDNDFVDLPSLSGLTSLGDLRIQNNKFTFEDIEPNIGVANEEFHYSPQDSVGEAADTIINEGSSLTMSVSVGGESNQYQWTKDGSVITGATDSSYTISSVEPDDSGSYICEITNTVATDLTLYSKPVNVTVSSSGVLDDLPTVYAMSVKRIAVNKKFEVRYSIPEKTSIKLGVYNINGTKVKEFSEEKTPGIYSREIDMDCNPAGAYFIKMEANKGKFSSTKKIVLVH